MFTGHFLTVNYVEVWPQVLTTLCLLELCNASLII